MRVAPGRGFLAAACLLGLLALPGRAQAPVELSPELERVATTAMSRLRSPYTPSHTVDMCPSAGALRDTIRLAAASGQSTDAIVEGVIARHGEQLRVLPKRSGAGLWAWIFPPLVLVGGAVVLIRRLRPAPGTATAGGDPPLSDNERDEVAAALREWERRGEAEA